jgi:hypothetical protein
MIPVEVCPISVSGPSIFVIRQPTPKSLSIRVPLLQHDSWGLPDADSGCLLWDLDFDALRAHPEAGGADLWILGPWRSLGQAKHGEPIVTPPLHNRFKRAKAAGFHGDLKGDRSAHEFVPQENIVGELLVLPTHESFDECILTLQCTPNYRLDWNGPQAVWDRETKRPIHQMGEAEIVGPREVSGLTVYQVKMRKPVACTLYPMALHGGRILEDSFDIVAGVGSFTFDPAGSDPGKKVELNVGTKWFPRIAMQTIEVIA